ncbi:MAG: HAMP domain-containing histidine kinase [Candidatus Muirbacterium halophilum]|nr:HAMP domain-containing histidine kinase [Candidatus Muirbacterium halophilum]
MIKKIKESKLFFAYFISSIIFVLVFFSLFYIRHILQTQQIDFYKNILNMQISKEFHIKIEKSMNLFDRIEKNTLKESDIQKTENSIKKVVIIENSKIISDENISLLNLYTNISQGISIGDFYLSNLGMLFPVIYSKENKIIMFFYDISELLYGFSYIKGNNIIVSDKTGNTIRFPEKSFETVKIEKISDNFLFIKNNKYMKLSKIPGNEWYIMVFPEKINLKLFIVFLMFSLIPCVIVFLIIKKQLVFLENIAIKLKNLTFDKNSIKKNFKLNDLEFYIKRVEEKIKSYENEICSYTNQILAFSQQINLFGKELEFANKKLMELEEMKINFLSSISHELRTPLVIIIGYNDLFLNDKMGNISLVQKNALNIVKKNLERLFFLIENMLNYSKMKENKFDFNPEFIDFYEIVEECIFALGPNIEEKKLNVRNLCIKGQNIVFIDREKALQMLLNFIINSIKFTDENGIIDIGKRKEDKNKIYFYVKDNGIGIKKSKLDKIFEHFYQVDQGYTKQFAGIGIGLSLAKMIADIHKGNVIVESTPGIGTTVILSFMKKI